MIHGTQVFYWIRSHGLPIRYSVKSKAYSRSGEWPLRLTCYWNKETMERWHCVPYVIGPLQYGYFRSPTISPNDGRLI